MKSGNLNFVESSGPLQACNGTPLPLTLPALKQAKLLGVIRIIPLMYPHLLVDKFVTFIVKIVENYKKFLPYQHYHSNETAK